jgi:hypothetical protein
MPQPVLALRSSLIRYVPWPHDDRWYISPPISYAPPKAVQFLPKSLLQAPVDLQKQLEQTRAHFPLNSMVTKGPDPLFFRHPTVKEAFTQAARNRFKAQLDDLDPRIRAKLEQPFGKDNLQQCFRSEGTLRHVLLPLWKSGFLVGDAMAWDNLAEAYFPAKVMLGMLDKYGDVDFNPLRGFPQDWESETSFNTDRIEMVSAAMLHFNGSVADVVRWIGGPHVAAHRDHHAILARLEQAGLPADLLATLRRIFFSGIPNYCNADATEENFLAFLRYGNHKTFTADVDKARKAAIKDNKRGFTLLFDRLLIYLLLHCHVTPQGMVDLATLFKNPRTIFDSSFLPFFWSMAINCWTTKDTEPPLTFAMAELMFMIWVYNMRITYPWLEIYLMDDDVSGAFRWLKYHPNLVALHASIILGLGCLNTGGTFGDNTTPSNFDPIALARRLLAMWIWTNDVPAQLEAKQFLPPVQLAMALLSRPMQTRSIPGSWMRPATGNLPPTICMSMTTCTQK